MQYDIFFSISQTPVDGHTPSEAQMFRNFFDQVKAADEQGYGVAWLAESHLSSEVQKRNRRPVIPHWQGEVGLNTDMLAMAAEIFRRTERIEVGSAIMNILCMGGPIAHAERIAAFLALHGLDEAEKRRIHVGFAAGRFDFMNEASGIGPRNELERVAWRALKGQVFHEAAEIFLRLLRGDTISSDDIRTTTLTRRHFRKDADWDAVSALTGGADAIDIERRWVFEHLQIVPKEFRRDLLQLVIGSHDPLVQEAVNAFLPVQVFNLSITSPEVIEDAHRRLTAAYHPDGGAWRRTYMPRTTFVFLNDEPGLTPQSQRQAAHAEARAALGAYWTALEGTLDPAKVERATNNALIGNVEDVAQEAVRRFHADDRLMLWFDFFNHDSDRVIRNQQAWMDKVAPRIAALLASA